MVETCDRFIRELLLYVIPLETWHKKFCELLRAMVSKLCFTVLGFVMINSSLSSRNYDTVECVTMDCKMKRKKMKLPRNLLGGDPYAYYQYVPQSVQPNAYGFANYQSYYGYPASYPTYAYQNPNNYYTGYTGYNALPWSYANQYPHTLSAVGSNRELPIAPQYDYRYCPSCTLPRPVQSAVNVEQLPREDKQTEEAETSVAI